MLGQLSVREMRFGLDTEITALLLKHGIRPFEVPISYFSRSHAQGKKITWLDALACIRILVRVRVARKDSAFRGDSFQQRTLGHDLGSSSHLQFVESERHAETDTQNSDVGNWDLAPDHFFASPLAREGQVEA